MSNIDDTNLTLGYLLENRIDEVRYMMPFLGGQELMFALSSSSCLAQVQMGQTVEEANMIPEQSKVTYLSSAALTEHAMSSGLLEPSKELMRLAAKHGCLEGMQVLRSLHPPCPWDSVTCSYAAMGGHLEMLQWARSQDLPCPWDELTCMYAAGGGHLEMLKWLRAQTPPCPWDAYTSADAADGGHLEMLQWARSQDLPCPWDAFTCRCAANSGHLDVLQWLRLQDPPCPWDWQTTSCARERGHHELLQWALDNGCPDLGR